MLSRNGKVVETNSVNAALLGCNTNVGILGSDTQAKAGLCYLLKYITNPPAEILESLSLLYNARRKVKEYPSKAEDSGAEQRTAMHFLSSYLNQTSGLHEISSQMAAVAILGMPAELCSHGFFLVFVNAAMAYALQASIEDGKEQLVDTELEFSDLFNTSLETNDEGYCSLVDPEEMEDPLEECSGTEYAMDEDVEPDVTGRDDDENPLRDSEAFGTSVVYTTGKGKVAVPQHIHYSFRSAELACLSLYEYASLIIVSEKRKGKAGVAETESISTEEDAFMPEADLGGRQANTTFPFAVGHPLRETHVQRIRSKSLIPVPVAYPPQPPHGKQTILTDEWKQQARKFARYVLTLFRPWTSKNGQLPGDLSWYAYFKFVGDLALVVDGNGQTHLERIQNAWVTNIPHGLRVSSKAQTSAQNLHQPHWVFQMDQQHYQELDRTTK